MPIYEYRCSGCKTQTEKISRADQKEIRCPECGQPAQRIVSVFAAKSGDTTSTAPACRPSSGFT